MAWIAISFLFAIIAIVLIGRDYPPKLTTGAFLSITASMLAAMLAGYRMLAIKLAATHIPKIIHLSRRKRKSKIIKGEVVKEENAPPGSIVEGS